MRFADTEVPKLVFKKLSQWQIVNAGCTVIIRLAMTEEEIISTRTAVNPDYGEHQWGFGTNAL